MYISSLDSYCRSFLLSLNKGLTSWKAWTYHAGVTATKDKKWMATLNVVTGVILWSTFSVFLLHKFFSSNHITCPRRSLFLYVSLHWLQKPYKTISKQIDSSCILKCSTKHSLKSVCEYISYLFFTRYHAFHCPHIQAAR